MLRRHRASVRRRSKLVRGIVFVNRARGTERSLPGPCSTIPPCPQHTLCCTLRVSVEVVGCSYREVRETPHPLTTPCSALAGVPTSLQLTRAVASQPCFSFASQGHVTLVASLYANGVVYLHEPTGEELLVYDTGHGRPGCSSGAAPGESPSASKPPAAAPELGDPVVSALSADASDVDPLLLTTGTDGTVRVHALTVLINGRRVAGRVHPSRRKQSKSKPDGDGTKKSNKSKKGSGDEKQGVVESSRDEEGKEDGVPGEVSGEHAQGMEVKAQFRLCLGSACPSTPAGGCEVDLGPGQAVADVELERRLTSADSPEKAITSTTAFFHRG